MTRRVAQDEVGADSGTPQEGAPAEAIREALSVYAEADYDEDLAVLTEDGGLAARFALRRLDSLLAYIKQLEGDVNEHAGMAAEWIESANREAERREAAENEARAYYKQSSEQADEARKWRQRAEAAEAQVKQLEGELHEEHCAIERVWADRKAETEKAVTAEAQVKQLEGALVGERSGAKIDFDRAEAAEQENERLADALKAVTEVGDRSAVFVAEAALHARTEKRTDA